MVRSLQTLFMGMVLAKYFTTFLGRIDWFPATDLAFKFSLQFYNGVPRESLFQKFIVSLLYSL